MSLPRGSARTAHGAPTLTDSWGNRCEGFGDCRDPNSSDCIIYWDTTGGTPCALCGACDGAGACSAWPADDAACGVIDCDGLDTICRDHADLGAARCESFGDCKDANTSDCFLFTNAPATTVCDGPACVANALDVDYCDGAGACPEATDVDCGTYVCDPAGCPSSCDDGADCVAGLCDLRDATCPDPTAVTTVDCFADPGALQSAIDACPAAPTCYLLVSGTCDPAAVSGREVFIAEAVGVPAAIVGLPGGTAFGAIAGADATLSGMTITSTTTSWGVECNGSVVTLLGSSVLSNGWAGVSAYGGCNATLRDTIVDNTTGVGALVTDGVLTIERSRVQRSFGGANVRAANPSASVSVVNSVIASGFGAGTDGIAVALGATGVIAHSTIANNSGEGVSCSGGATATVDRSIVTSNAGAEVTCSIMATSDVQDSGADTCGGDPVFADFSEYHLAAGSPCIDDVACDPAVTDDFDGDPRPLPAGGACDVGADEYVP